MKRLFQWLFLQKPLQFKELILLAGPALLVGFLMRLAFCVVVPQGYFGSDSGSYYDLSDQLFNHGVIEFDEKRRWFYPVFLALMSIIPVPPWYSVPVVQHAIGLLTLLGIGWASAQVVQAPRLVVPGVTLLAAIWPRMLWYEHEFIAESLMLAAFVAVIALLLTPGVVTSRFGLVVLMLAFALLAGMKGACRFLWLGSVIGLFVIHRNPRRWFWSKCSLALAALSVLLVSTVGKNSQGDWLILSSSLPLVRLDGEPHSRYRDALSEQIFEARQFGEDYPWKVKLFKKRLNNKDPQVVHADWADLTRDASQFSQVARSFWTEAIAQNPLQFLRFTTKTIGIALSRPVENQRFDLSQFWDTQWLATKRRWVEEPSYLKRVFGVDFNRFEELKQRGSSRLYFFRPVTAFVDRHFNWLGRSLHGGGQPGGDPIPSFVPKPMGLFAVMGMIAGSTLSPMRLKCVVLLLPCSLYLFGTYAVGDAVARYLQPVDWLGFVFVGVFIDVVINQFRNILMRFQLASF